MQAFNSEVRSQKSEVSLTADHRQLTSLSPLTSATCTHFDGLSGWHDVAQAALPAGSPGIPARCSWPAVTALVRRGILEYLHRYAICRDHIFQGTNVIRVTLAWADGTRHRTTQEVYRDGTFRNGPDLQTCVRNFCLENVEGDDAIATHCRHVLNHCEL